MKRSKRLLSILLTAMLVMSASCVSYAETAAFSDAESEGSSEPTEVTVVDSVTELAAESSTADNDPFFTIDVSKKAPSDDLATDEVTESVKDILGGSGSTSEKKDAVIEALEESGLYRAEEGEGRTVEVTSEFAYQRLRLVAGRRDNIEAYGAVSAVYYDDHYLLSYESEEAAKAAYEALEAEYGAGSVFIDIPLKISSDAAGWGTDYMGMDYEQTVAASGSEVTVAVADTGITSTHAVFGEGRIVSGYDFVNGDSDPADDNGHGTKVSGVVAESTPSNVKIMPLKIMDEDGDGSIENLLNALEYADENGADIVNLSLGGYLLKSSYLQYYEKKFAKYSALIICSASNESEDMDADGIYEFPGELSSTVCVSAIDSSSSFCSFSNYGSAVDFCAPGESIKLANKNGTYSTSSGTSFSSPYLASAAALVKAEYSDLSNSGIVNALESVSIDLGDEGKDVYYGAGCPIFEESGDIDIDYDIEDDAGSDDVYDDSEESDEDATAVVSGITNKKYTGKAITQNFTLKYGGNLLVEGTDYTVSYSNNKNVGTATLKISGIGSYYGYITRTFKILPKGTKLSKVSRGRKALTVKWKKQKTKMSSSRITGYQIQVATNKSFTKNKKTVTVKGYSKTSKKIKKLKARKKYYVRVRTYKTVEGKKYYSAWSSVKTKKTR